MSKKSPIYGQKAKVARQKVTLKFEVIDPKPEVKNKSEIEHPKLTTTHRYSN